MTSQIAISCQNIAKHFGQHTVLDSISLTFSYHQSTAIIGPNGSGKTTLLRILAGLAKPVQGQVFLEKTSIEHLQRPQIARKLAVIPQAKPHVFEFSAIEAVLMGFYAQSSRFSLPSNTHVERALEAMAQMEVAHLANQSLQVLSGGELQRVLMARTLVSNTPIWLLDEPTSNLDLKHQLALLEQVKTHCTQGGCAIAILHDLHLVHRYFDRVIVLKGAHILADGPPAEILTEELVADVFGVNMARHIVDDQHIWVAK